MRESLSKKIAWLLPPKVLLWAVIRAFSLLNIPPLKSYNEVYDAIVKKYHIDEQKM